MTTQSHSSASVIGTVVKTGLATICFIYIAKNLVRDLKEFHKNNRDKLRKHKKKERFYSNDIDREEANISEIRQRLLSSAIRKSNGNNNSCEVLVHNVAHTDLIFEATELMSKSRQRSQSKENNSKSSISSNIICRPRFSAFSYLSERMLNHLSKSKDVLELANYPIYDRKENQLKLPSTPRRQRDMPVGFKGFDLVPLSCTFLI